MKSKEKLNKKEKSLNNLNSDSIIIKEVKMAIRKKDITLIFWIIVVILVIGSLISIPLKQTLFFILLAIVSLILIIFNKQIIDMIWSSIKEP